MRFINLCLLPLLSYALPAPAPAPAAESNYQLLEAAILEFQATSAYTFELILAALSQEQTLLNTLSTTSVPNATLFLPSDAGFLNLNIATMTQADIVNYLKYHVAESTLAEAEYIRTISGDDIKVTYTIAGVPTLALSAEGIQANIVGSSNPVSNIFLNFIDVVMQPPVSLPLTATFYDFVNFNALLTAAGTTLPKFSQDNTVLIPSEAALDAFFLANCPATAINPAYLTELLDGLIITSGRYYSDELEALVAASATPVVVTAVGGEAITVTSANAIISLTSSGVTADVTEADLFFQGGVAHVIDTVLLPVTTLSVC